MDLVTPPEYPFSRQITEEDRMAKTLIGYPSDAGGIGHSRRGEQLRDCQESCADRESSSARHDDSARPTTRHLLDESRDHLMTAKPIKPPRKGKQPRASTKQQRGGRR